MISDLIPADVRQLVLDKIDSVSELEALLLLRKCADQDWTAAAVSRRLYIDETVARQILAGLTAGGLCAATGETYRYEPVQAGQREVVEKLADLYTRYLIPVTNLIHNKPARIQKFADAFIFRKEK
jgi:hypothetical protein